MQKHFDDDDLTVGKRWLKPTTREQESKNVATRGLFFATAQPFSPTVSDHNFNIHFASEDDEFSPVAAVAGYEEMVGRRTTLVFPNTFSQLNFPPALTAAASGPVFKT